MALAAVSSGLISIGFNWELGHVGSSSPATNAPIMDAANEAVIFIGHCLTNDGASHTIDTTGPSAISWRCVAATFVNAATTVKIGIAAVDTAAGPPARAVNVADVITFDVNAAPVGGGGGIAVGWVTSAMTAGTKTIANGDLIAIAFQMTARGGTDSISIQHSTATDRPWNTPTETNYVNAAYAGGFGVPNAVITFSDGTLGWIFGSFVFAGSGNIVHNSGSASNKELGQLFQLPFPSRVCGIYASVSPSTNAANWDAVLYSDPLGTPVAERTVSMDANVTSSINTARPHRILFPTPYFLPANTPVVAAVKPGATNITSYYFTLGSATHRATHTFGPSSHGVTRTTGAFSNVNSNLDHFNVGLLVNALEHGVSPTYGIGI